MGDSTKDLNFEDDGPIVDDFLDCQGRRRFFRLEVGPTPVGPFLYASELNNGEPTGWQAMIEFNPELEAPPFYEMRQRLSARLATRDLVRDPDTGHLEILNDLVRGQITHGEESDLAPALIVDGEEITWDELGALLSSYEGWGVRLRICTAGEE